jgi:hypothetical protein
LVPTSDISQHPKKRRNIVNTKKRFHAPASVALAAVILIVVSLVAIGFYIAMQGEAHERSAGSRLEKTTSSVELPLTMFGQPVAEYLESVK